MHAGFGGLTDLWSGDPRFRLEAGLFEHSGLAPSFRICRSLFTKQPPFSVEIPVHSDYNRLLYLRVSVSAQEICNHTRGCRCPVRVFRQGE
jgi:hypothetical protein